MPPIPGQILFAIGMLFLFPMIGLFVVGFSEGGFLRRQKYPLHAAARKGKLDRLEQLLQEDRKINEPDAEYNAPLHIAVELGRLDCCRFLIDCGASVKARNAYAETPLHLAAENGHLDICRLLLDHGATADPKEDEGRTPLHQAAEEGFVGICKLLLEHGADSTKTEMDGFTPFELARLYANKTALAELAKILFVPTKKTKKRREPVAPLESFVSRWKQTDEMIEYHISCWKPFYEQAPTALITLFGFGFIAFFAYSVWQSLLIIAALVPMMCLAFYLEWRINERVRLDRRGLRIRGSMMYWYRNIPIDSIRTFTDSSIRQPGRNYPCIATLPGLSATFGTYLPEQERLWMLEQFRQVLDNLLE